MNEQQAYKLLIKKHNEYDKVDRCLKTKDKYIFFMDTGQTTTDDSEGVYSVDINTGEVENFSMVDLLMSDEPAEEIDPEIFAANKLFNL